MTADFFLFSCIYAIPEKWLHLAEIVVKPIVGSSGNPKNSLEIIGTKRWVRPEIIHIDAELCALPIPADILSGALQIIAFVTNTFFCTTAIQQITSNNIGCHKNGSFLPLKCLVLIQCNRCG